MRRHDRSDEGDLRPLLRRLREAEQQLRHQAARTRRAADTLARMSDELEAAIASTP